MRNLFLAVLTASVLGYGVAAHAACPIPNPNNTPIASGGFVDGCTLSAAGLNELLNDVTPPELPITNFGAKCDGVTDDTAAIQAAINALPATGGGITFPARTCLTTSTINIGNGSASGGSSTAGVVLRGIGNPVTAAPYLTGFPTTTAPAINYTGSGVAVSVNGPVAGWGINNLRINCSIYGGTTGLRVTSAQFGNSSDLQITGCQQGLVSNTVSPPTGFINADSLNNNYRNTSISCALAGCTAILFTGVINGPDTDLNILDGLTIIFLNPGTSLAPSYGIRLQNCDGNYFINTHMAGAFTPPGLNTFPILFDYAYNGGFPGGNSFIGVDVGAINGVGFSNLGNPSTGLFNNFVSNISGVNFQPPPNIPGLVVDHNRSTPLNQIGSLVNPTLVGAGGGTATYSTQAGYFSVSGYIYHVDYNIILSSVGSLSGAITISPLPFVMDGSPGHTGSCAVGNWTNMTLDAGYTSIVAFITDSGGTSTLNLAEVGSTKTGSAVTAAMLSNTTQLIISCSYIRNL